MSKIVPVILCGGSGTRLWPRSRVGKPKPFLALVGEETLFEATLSRCASGDDFAPPVIVTGDRHLEHVEAQLRGVAEAQVIVEPAARNTAAAIALAALRLPGEAVMLICPSDHHIPDCEAFQGSAHAAAELAGKGWLVAFAITPEAPETGFGYIKQGAPLGECGFVVERFVEKPDRPRAEAFLAEGGYFWNGGIFAFRADRFVAELETHRPAIAEAARQAVALGHASGHRFYPDFEAFSRIASESVDHAVMENTARAAMVPARMGWSDIGNWQALHAALGGDESGNVSMGRTELVDSRNVFVHSDGPRVSVIGLENVIVVVDGDEVLVCSTEGAQKVGKLSGAVNQ